MWDAISGGLDMPHSSAKLRDAQPRLLGRFNFKGGDQQKIVGSSRAAAGRAPGQTLIQGGNVLLLDEPSNDLDVETCARWKTRCWSSPAARW